MSAPSIALDEQLSLSSFLGLAFRKSFQKEGVIKQVVMRNLAKLHSVRGNVLYVEASTGGQLPSIGPASIISCR